MHLTGCLNDFFRLRLSHTLLMTKNGKDTPEATIILVSEKPSEQQIFL
jgi:hypothetical protein